MILFDVVCARRIRVAVVPGRRRLRMADRIGGRETVDQPGFQFCMHFCIGAHVARMEIRMLVDTFLRRVPNLNSGMFDMAAAVRHPSSFQWGWNDLPVTVAR